MKKTNPKKTNRGSVAVAALAVAAVLSAGAGSSSQTQRTISSRSRQPKKIVLNTSDKSGCAVDAKFDPGCSQLPFPQQTGLAIDAHCPTGGCAKDDDNRAQDSLKDNLCRTGTPVPITYADFDSLQRHVDDLVSKGQLTYGNGKPPKAADRTKLKSTTVHLAEGDLVTLEAFVLDAKHDDAYPVFATGEAVNCKNNNPNWNDIHIALGQTANAAECESVTAEIIPHLRPATWNRFDCDPRTHDNIPGTSGIMQVKGLHVRITGQLFFDGSHKPVPCTGPKRRTSWEIHPVYTLEADKSPDNSGQWISFSDWVKQRGF
jgi:hypothetical protein